MRIRAAKGYAGLQCRVSCGLYFRSGRAGLTNHHARMFYGVGERLVVARQAIQFGPGFGVDAAKASLRDRRRHAIGFWKDDVESDRDRPQLRDLGDEVCHRRAGPRPLPDRFQARLIDIHDNDRPDLLRPRPKHLKEIKSPGPQFLQRPRIGEPQRHQGE